jgi:hypothetical protein
MTRRLRGPRRRDTSLAVERRAGGAGFRPGCRERSRRQGPAGPFFSPFPAADVIMHRRSG